MNPKSRVLVSLMAIGLGMLTMGGSCLFPSPGNDGEVALDFLNTTDFTVNAFVNGTLVDVVPPQSNPPVSFLVCSPGISFQIDGDFLAQEGDIPAVNSLVFEEGVNFLCGDTLQVDFLIDDNGDFALDGLSVAP